MVTDRARSAHGTEGRRLAQCLEEHGMMRDRFRHGRRDRQQRER
jgi:hypothetical protein